MLAESSGSAGYLQNPTSFESPLLASASFHLQTSLWAPVEEQWAGNRQGAEAAAALCLGHQLKMQGLLLTTDAWKVTSWKPWQVDIYTEGLSKRAWISRIQC